MITLLVFITATLAEKNKKTVGSFDGNVFMNRKCRILMSSGQ